MKMLFYSSDSSEVERVKTEFKAAGIPCEVRKGTQPKASPHAELWIRNDQDCHRAFMLCVHLGLGFSRRSGRPASLDDHELEHAED